ncbi:hypothetical protein SISNIDRAFT_489619 [Sistotremastrum niveocremeum HHB9708]|uniref:DUF6535 domain-containing protein n=1 Tax=Sistotremastrum niveocremeum HHB9708 TaxID=1314777 RepID=A0A164PR85_9AGAM|nr:hypothetical protein SISNIDRAFT_489619 [Sistotremastrum niveocremeum HHB9708]
MSAPPDPPDPYVPNDFLSIPNAQPPSLAAIADPFDTPMFNRLLKLIEEQNATSLAQREALEKQNAMIQEQQKVMEDQREVMKDMRRALDDQRETMVALLVCKSTDTEVRTDTPSVQPHRRASQVASESHNGIAKLPATQTQSTQAPALDNPTTLDRIANDPPHAEIPQDDHASSPPQNPVENRQADTAEGLDEGVAEASVEKSSKDSFHEAVIMLHDMMKNIKETLVDHGKKFDVLIRDAIKDDQPYDLKPMEDESTCTALFEIAMTRTKEEVDEWIKRMDVSLVFIALFSAVLTAFLVPAVQALSPSSSNSSGTTDTPPPLPNISAQNILNAVLSVLGRQWMSKLTTRPEGSTYRERLLRHLAREALAKRWLRILVEGLHIILLGSIGLFMTGLLYQLRNLAGSFDEDAPRLLITWKVGLSFSSVILAVVAAATIHALFYEVSPFGGPFSKLLLKIIKLLSKLLDIVTKPLGTLIEWLDECISWIPWRPIMLVLVILTMAPLFLACLLIEEWRVKFDTKDKEKLVGAFMDLIAEASDPKLLERAVGSFSYVEWFQNGEGAADQLEKTQNRLLATDTSVRVRETLRTRAKQFVPSDSQQFRDMGQRLTRDHVQCFLGLRSYPLYFRNQLLETAFEPDNSDLRPLAALPFEECVARVLCSYNHKGKLGDRGKIFYMAEDHCHNLLYKGTRDDVTRILSHVDPLDLIKSIIQHPRGVWYDLVDFLVKDRKHEILREINEFVKTVDQSELGPLSLSQVFIVLASPPPTEVDLSPLIDYISRHPHWDTWRRCVDDEFRDEDGDRYRTKLDSLSSPPTGAIASASIPPASPSHPPSNAPIPGNASQSDPLLPPSADSPSPGPANTDLVADTFADSDSDIPMTTLIHPPPALPSSESTSGPSLAPAQHSQAVFDQSPALESAQRKD